MRRGVKRRRVPKRWRKHKKRRVERLVKSEKKAASKYHEAKVTYTKKKPNKSSKAKLRFARKVRNVLANVTGLKTAITQTFGNFNSATGGQGIVSFMIGAGAVGFPNDLSDLVQSIDPGQLNNVTLKLELMEMNIILSNGQSKWQETTYTFDPTTGVVPAHNYTPGDQTSNNVIYVRVYHVVAKHDLDATNGAQIGTIWSNLMATEMALGAPYATPVTVNTLGVTPFDCPQFCTQFKILDIKDIMLGPGELYKLVLRTKRMKFIQGSRIQMNAFIQGTTEGYVIVIHGGPNKTTGQVDVANLAYTQVNRYHYRHIQDDDNAIGQP